MMRKPPRFERLIVALTTATGLLIANSAQLAWAERTLRIKTLPETPLPFVTTLVAPLARSLAVSETASAVAIAHQPESAVHVSILRIDPQGQAVAEEPRTLVLPKPANLASRKTQVLGVAWHPRFPLLYVWQDVDPNPDNSTIDPAQTLEFDHLLIYSLEEPSPKLLLATARGTDYACGCAAGGFKLDDAGVRLYIPNQRRPGPNKTPVGAIGWITIEPDGLPGAVAPPVAGTVPAVSPTTETVVVTAPPAVQLDPAAAAAARAAKLAAWGAQAVRATAEVANGVFDVPCPYCYAPINDNLVMLAAYAGPVSWVLDDRLGRVGYFYVQPQVPYRYRVAVHPTLPSVYLTMLIYDGHLARFEHADGYFTLAPQSLYVDNVVIHSPPLVIAKRSQVAFGAVGKICLIDIDAEGKFLAKGVQMTVNNPKASAVAWSDKFERLYVAVEKTP